MPVFYAAVDLAKNELRNAVVQNLGSAPAAPGRGQLYYDSTANILYWFNGSGWVAAQGGSGLLPATTVTTQAIGDTPVVGTATTYAREDHRHGEPAFGPVAAETAARSGRPLSNGVQTSLARSDHTHGNPVHTAASHNTIPLSALATPTGALNLGGFQINALADPTNATDAATKQYTDKPGRRAVVEGGGPGRLRRQCRHHVRHPDGRRGGAGCRGSAAAEESGHRQPERPLPGVGRNVGSDVRRELAGADTGDGGLHPGGQHPGRAPPGRWSPTPRSPSTSPTWPTPSSSGGASYSAGNGLTLAGNVFAVGAGTGILTTPGSTAVDTTVIATQAYVGTQLTGVTRKYVTTLSGVGSPETCSLTTWAPEISRLLRVQRYNTPYTAVGVDWDATTVNTVTVRYNPVLGAGFRLVVVG